MAEKRFVGRFGQKIDTTANWDAVADTFIPLKGEIIVYQDAPTDSSSKIKIGDGNTPVGKLAFLTGEAQQTDLNELSNRVQELEERFDSTIGDIEAALDAIIAIQEELMGGSGGTITFFIDEEECTAEEGMTWREWIGSPYDITNGDFCIDSNDSVCWDTDAPVFGPNVYVYADDVIIAGANYYR